MTDIEHCLICLGPARTNCSGACPCPHDGNDIADRGGYCSHPDKPRFGDGIRPDGWQIIPVEEAWKESAVSAELPLSAVPRDQWPTWAKALSVIAMSTDAGVGDIIHRLAGNLPAPVLAMMKLTKMTWTGEKTCNCEADRQRLNQLYPLVSE